MPGTYMQIILIKMQDMYNAMKYFQRHVNTSHK